MLAGRYTDIAAPLPDSRVALRGGIYAERVTARGIEIRSRLCYACERAWSHTCATCSAVGQGSTRHYGTESSVCVPLRNRKKRCQCLEMTLSDDLRVACDVLVPPGSAVVDSHNTSG